VVQNLQNFLGFNVGNGVKQAGIQVKQSETKAENHTGINGKKSFVVLKTKPGQDKNARKGKKSGNSVRNRVCDFLALGLVVEPEFPGSFGFRAFDKTHVSFSCINVSTFILYKKTALL
jgi:hypothetical protein